ncbi:MULTISPECIES: type 1 fimbrial protein [unclassified Tatumella]|uniref:fimbrial protein n=1 Tax=unclassified Tatumella TaxID=2649542 RepID=UPI00201292EB|nr:MULTISPECIES: type 1 fimbrial protein [unclassified Tatumella]
MRKLIGGVCVFCTCLAVSAADVTITISGKVVAKPCTIATTNANVALGNLPTFSFVNAGSASDWKTVTLDLTNCPIGTSSVKATFTGTSDSTGTYFSNQGTAGNIALQLADSSGNNLTNGGSLTSTVSDATLSTAFNLQVRAITPVGKVTQGTIQSTIDVTYTWQ